MFATKKEAIDSFKAALTSAKVGAEWTWEMAVRSVGEDERFNALKNLREKKAAFAEYQDDVKKLERDDKRRQEREIRDNFTAMLKACKSLDLNSTYK